MRVLTTALTFATAALALVPGYFDRRQSSVDTYISTQSPISKAGVLVSRRRDLPSGRL